MKVSHSMCGSHEDSDIIFGPAQHFGRQSFSTRLYHKLSVALIFLLMSLLQALSQHSVIYTKNFLSHSHPTSSWTHAHFVPTRITLLITPTNVSTHNSHMLTRPMQDSNFRMHAVKMYNLLELEKQLTFKTRAIWFCIIVLFQKMIVGQLMNMPSVCF